MKRVQNSVKRAQFLKCLVNFKSIKEAARILRKSEFSLYKMRERLVDRNYLNADFSLTDKGLNAIKEVPINLNKVQLIRLHNVGLVAGLVFVPMNWDERREKWAIEAGGRSWKVPSGMFSEVRVLDWLRVRTTPSSVVIYFGDIYADDPVSAKNKLFDLSVAAVRRVEKLLGIRLHRRGEFILRTGQQHFGFVKNDLARELISAGYKVRIQDMTGKTRVMVDDSYGFQELETPHAVKGEDDARKVHALLEDVVVNEFSLREFAGRLEALEAFAFRPVREVGVRREVS